MKSCFALILAALVSTSALAAKVEWLVTPDEVQQDAARSLTSPPPLRPKAITPDAPELTLVKPASLTEPLKAPFPINLVFKARDGASIVPDTFRALYGTFRLDITERIVKHAKITPSGINLEKAEIPSGSHKLVLQVKDDRNRQGETELRFSVE